MAITKNIKTLSEQLRPVAQTEDADAAVALLLKPMNDDFDILVVKRVNSPRDPWSGQMALPGGKRESKDVDLRHTVIRETLEETGINLEDRCRFLGTLKTQCSNHKPEMNIIPFVILLEHDPTIRLNEKELEKFTWIPLKELAKHRETARFSFGESPAYVIDDYVIWGLTYRIIEELLRIIGQ
jgi:8-oxo-dGTP diphosphatase